MTAVKQGDGYKEWEHILIPMADGRKLAARVWMPEEASMDHPVPAILEYLPYRKRQGTAARDESYYPVFARAGYAGVRVDICGTGESDGVFDDEYSERELSDGVEVLNWIATQDWCTGKLGMMGISWGGFNSLQIAALKPSPLKAVISIGSTVDRYNADIHYKDGCQLYSNLSWASVMQNYAYLPADPLLVGEAEWKDRWLERLNGAEHILGNWLSHQRYDEFWKHGSIQEDYSAIEAPCLVISGWADAYRNAPPEAAENLKATVKAMNGPWIHKYPHFAYPFPRVDFHQEALRWWDCWLKGEENKAPELPAYRAYISENVRPSNWREHEEGRWVAEESWPSDNIQDKAFYLGVNHALSLQRETGQSVISICSPQDTGTACGEVFTVAPDTEMPGDQRIDDAGSLVFETGVLTEAVEILGRPELSLKVSINAPVGNLAVRLIDVHPDGLSHRVSLGTLNLAHRRGNETPEEMAPNQAETVTIKLDHAGYRFLAGHKLRISISTAYWPYILPSPTAITAQIELGEESYINLPIRKDRTQEGDKDIHPIPEPERNDLLPVYPSLSEGKHDRKVIRDLPANRTMYKICKDTGEIEVPDHGLRTRFMNEDQWEICPDDPEGATGNSRWIYWASRGEWSVRFVTEVSMKMTTTHFETSASMQAFDGDEEIFKRNFEKRIPRDLM